MMKLFTKHRIHVRPTVKADIEPIAQNMRGEDRDEIWASHLITPVDALTAGLNSSVVCDTVFKDEEPIAMYGVVPNPYKFGTASIWLLGTDGLTSVPNAFGKMSREIICDLWEKFPVLYNYVDVRNRKSIQWLKSCGAQFEDPKPYGVARLPFMHFQLKKAA